jgi:hypothetical protein
MISEGFDCIYVRKEGGEMSNFWVGNNHEKYQRELMLSSASVMWSKVGEVKDDFIL